MKQRIKLINKDCMPKYSTKHSACLDCFANITENIIIYPHDTKAIPLGFCLDLNWGMKAMLYPRSGLALNSNITLENAPGIIDADYVDELKAIIHNDGQEPYVIHPLDKVCQMDIIHYNQINFVEVEKIRDKTEEHKGFGSTDAKI